MTEDIFAEAERRMNKLAQDFADAEITEVVGLVGATDAGGSKSKGDDEWTLLVTLDGWKYSNGSVQDSRATLRKLVSHDELKKYQKEFHSYTPFRLTAKVVEDSELGCCQIQLEELVEKSDDHDLLSLAKELQKPITFNHSIFGEFTFDRSVNWFSASTFWSEAPITLNLSCDETDKNDFLEVAQKLWESKDEWIEKVNACILTYLFDMKNGEWAEVDANGNNIEISKEQFLERLELESIIIEEEGDIEFWFNDGNLFFGHSIHVNGNIVQGLEYAAIAG